MARSTSLVLPKKVSLLVATICLIQNVSGLGTRVVDQDAEATARGDAFTATADNPSAIYYNPAGISQLAGTQLLMGGYAITYKSRAKLDVDDHTYSNHSDPQAIPQFYATTKLPKVPITLGLGIYVPFGFSIDYPNDVPFRTLARVGSIQFFSINPALAIQITRTLSFGFGPSLNYGKADLSRGVFDPPLLSKGDDFHFRGEDWSASGNLGVLWQPHPMHSFGFTYFSPSTFNFSGLSHLRYGKVQTDVTLAPGLVRRFTVAPSADETQHAEASFHFPQHLMAGYSFRPTPDWNFEADIDWTDWDSLNDVTLKQKSGEIKLPFNWRSSFLYEFGVTRRWHDWRFSLGYVYSESSVPSASFNPIVPDGNRNIVSAGVGRSFGATTVDLAYQFTWGKTTIEQGSLADGDYRFEAHALTLSLGYHF